MKNIKKTLFSKIFLTAFFSAQIFALELILTRLFSAVYWYHWAFLAISMGLLGSAFAGLAITRFPRFFADKKFKENVIVLSIIYTLSLFGVLGIFCFFPNIFILNKLTDPLSNLGQLSLWFIVLGIPFFISSIVIFTVFKQAESNPAIVYIYDLIGGLFGCLLGFYLLEFGGPIKTIYILAAVTIILAIWLAQKNKRNKIIICLIILFGIVFCWHSNIFQLKNIKLNSSQNIEKEYWNAISKISVSKEIANSDPFLWSKSPKANNNQNANYRLLAIDDNALTPVYKFDGNLKNIQFLKNDLPALAYEINKPQSAFIIGLGGGKDALTAKVFQCQNIVASEVNNKIYQILKTDLRDYSGRLVDDPDIHIYNQESRSYLESTNEQFDLIQASLVDSWAASQAGAYTLAENRLYTVEAWQTYFQHLTNQGVLAVTRWYSPGSPQELEKLISLGKNAWQNEGIKNPQEHLVIIANQNTSGMALIMWYKNPIEKTKLAEIKNLADQKGFSLIYSPSDQNAKINNLLINNASIANTDDRPFFFNLLNFQDIFAKQKYSQLVFSANYQAVINILFILFLVAVIYLIIYIYILNLFKKSKEIFSPANLLLFTLSGFCFMALETIFMQRSMSYLGHPVWSIIISLIIFILGSVLGNLFLQKYLLNQNHFNCKKIIIYLVIFVIIFLINIFVFPILALKVANSGWLAKIILINTFFLPLSFFVSWPFVFSLNNSQPKSLPYLLAFNSLAGIFGSALIVLCSLFFGFKISLILILLIYIPTWLIIIKSNKTFNHI